MILPENLPHLQPEHLYPARSNGKKTNGDVEKELYLMQAQLSQSQGKGMISNVREVWFRARLCTQAACEQMLLLPLLSSSQQGAYWQAWASCVCVCFLVISFPRLESMQVSYADS